MTKKKYISDIVERLMRLQDKFMPEAQEFVEDVEDERVTMLRVVGYDGESILLQYKKGRLRYAPPNAKPYHTFRCSTDTFLHLITGEKTMREAITKRQFIIEKRKTRTIDLVECEKWSQAFARLSGILTQTIGM